MMDMMAASTPHTDAWDAPSRAQALLSTFWHPALAGERDLCSQSGLARSEKSFRSVTR